MRSAFIETLCELAGQDERIWLLSGDLGYGILERFIQQFPDRYVNVGVAEQNMTGVAAGLALEGKTVFTYSIANFPVMRCLEQVRNDVCYHNLNVKIVAVGGGLAYGAAGYTHHGIEDLAVMKVLPNMTVVAPGDPVEARCATHAIAGRLGPCYLRLGKGGEPIVHRIEPNFQLGQAIWLRHGENVSLISTGGMLEVTIKAAELLSDEGHTVNVLSMHTVHLIDEDAIRHCANQTPLIVTVEEHGLGGLGSSVAEVIAQMQNPARLAMLRLKREPPFLAGSQAQLRSAQNLSPEGIVSKVNELLSSGNRK